MSGNLWEWCWDWYGNYPADSTNYTGVSSGSERIMRGGSWDDGSSICAVSNRSYDGARYKDTYYGFRLAHN